MFEFIAQTLTCLRIDYLHKIVLRSSQSFRFKKGESEKHFLKLFVPVEGK